MQKIRTVNTILNASKTKIPYLINPIIDSDLNITFGEVKSMTDQDFLLWCIDIRTKLLEYIKHHHLLILTT